MQSWSGTFSETLGVAEGPAVDTRGTQTELRTFSETLGVAEEGV